MRHPRWAGWILAFIVFGGFFVRELISLFQQRKEDIICGIASLKIYARSLAETQAVSGITAVLEPGIYGLLGANGAGENNTFADDLRSLATYCRSGMSGWDSH